MVNLIKWLFGKKRLEEVLSSFGEISPCKKKMAIKSNKSSMVEEIYCGSRLNNRPIYCNDCLEKRRNQMQEARDKYFKGDYI